MKTRAYLILLLLWVLITFPIEAQNHGSRGGFGKGVTQARNSGVSSPRPTSTPRLTTPQASKQISRITGNYRLDSSKLISSSGYGVPKRMTSTGLVGSRSGTGISRLNPAKPYSSNSAKSVTSASTRIHQNRMKGKAFEKEVISRMLSNKRTSWRRVETSIPGTTKRGQMVFTKPDVTRLGEGGRIYGLTEIKNVKNLSYTKQIQAQVGIAKKNNSNLNLIVSQNTKSISKPLNDAIRSTGGKIIRYNSNTGKFGKF